MILFHGSTEVIQKPEIRQPERTLDYGRGFYLTSSYEQAEKWVKRKLSSSSQSCGYVNIYNYDCKNEIGLDVLTFNLADESWLDFVMANRTNPNFNHSHDIVKGPVADDRVYAAFALFEARLLDKQQLIKELRTYRLVDQVLLHTEPSLRVIEFINAETVKL